jgi:hypothetical protein
MEVTMKALRSSVVLLLLAVVALACGGGSGERTPSAVFKSILTQQAVAVGQSVIVEIQFVNISNAATWTIFYDNDTDSDNGKTPIEDGAGAYVLELWDTTGVAAGIWYVGVIVTDAGTVSVFYSPSTVSAGGAASPTVTITAPAAAAEYEIGAQVAIAANVTNLTGFEWYLVGSNAKDPLSPNFSIARLAGTATVNYNWNTAEQTPAAFYIGAIARRGDVISYAFTNYLVVLTFHDTWFDMSSENAPESRNDALTAWTGFEFIVWGGIGAAGDLITGSVYSPWLDAWNDMSLTNAPTARRDAKGVWCGDRFIVWGGFANGLPLNDGAAYFPGTDTWVPLPSAGAPGPRRNFSAVWTGAVLMIWGGESDTARFNDGAMYNPTTNIWTALPTTGAPAARSYHSAVWADSKMIVWGGKDVGALNDGGIWNGNTGLWEALPTVAGQSPRADHFAAYTPSRGMVVYGGNDGTSPVGSVENLNPTAGTWTTVAESAANAPDPYNDRAVALTGKYLFSWGGFFNGFSNAGAVLDLDTMTWSPITTVNAPVASSLSCTVFTGSVVIVWGGLTNGGSLGTGKIYFP